MTDIYQLQYIYTMNIYTHNNVYLVMS